MSARSSNDIWAVGNLSNKGTPLTVHWDGANWSVVHNPAENQNAFLVGVVTIGDKYVWAAGYINSPPGVIRPLIEHFDGRRWLIDRSYNPPNQSVLQAITGTARSNIWTGGYYNGGGSALIERWDQTTHSWNQSPTSIGNYIDSMSARSSTDVWAVGPPELGGPFVERWDGTSWTSVPYPRGGDAVIGQVSATASTGHTWVVGTIVPASGYIAFADRYRAGQWQDMRVLQVGSYGTRLGSIAPVPGSADVWTVGDYDDSSTVFHNLAERFTCT
jgi:hypothetical protein